MDIFFKSSLLIFVLLNPFIMSIYLIQLIKSLEFGLFSQLLLRASIMSFIVFVLFAWLGEIIFDDVLQIRFLAFMIFGGITFLIIGIRLILGVGPPVESIKPGSTEIAGAIAMPFIIGPGTISASVIVGSQTDLLMATLSIALGLFGAVASMILLKKIHDWVQKKNERMVERYTEIAGRVTALFTGSFAVDMILKGIERWQMLQ